MLPLGNIEIQRAKAAFLIENQKCRSCGTLGVVRRVTIINICANHNYLRHLRAFKTAAVQNDCY